jgi:hypothetical protein
MKIGEIVFAFVFVGVWTAVTIGADVMIFRGIARQGETAAWPTVQGTVAQSRVKRSRGSEGGSVYSAEITYRYTVGGREYESDRYRFGDISSSSRGRAQRIVDRYPAGGPATVHYNPSDPSEAVLSADVDGMDMFLLLFLAPFNLVMIGGWIYLGRAISIAVVKPPAGGAPILRRHGRVHVRLPRLGPLEAAGAAMLGITFVAVFAVGFGTGMDPPKEVVASVWVLAAGVAVSVYIWKRFTVGSGAKDLVIDEQKQSLSLPQTFGRKRDVLVRYEDVDRIEVDTEVVTDNKGRSTTYYIPTLIHRADGAEQREKLARWSSRPRADSLAQWLRGWVEPG